MSASERVTRVFDAIRQASGHECAVRIVSDIDGDDAQAAAQASTNSVLITRRMAEELTDDELAWIFAHEIAHLADGHPTKRVKKVESLFGDALSALVETDRKLRGSGKNPVQRGVSMVVGAGVRSVGAFLDAQKLSREQEFRADAQATVWTREAGYNPTAGIEALRKLHGGTLPSSSFFSTIASTHPDPSRRATRITDAGTDDVDVSKAEITEFRTRLLAMTTVLDAPQAVAVKQRLSKLTRRQIVQLLAIIGGDGIDKILTFLKDDANRDKTLDAFEKESGSTILLDLADEFQRRFAKKT
ncbi:MAG: M48 family metalloprotease [Candidatus Poribacteria bacterium]|nr:M48 family metalloprotease [Candidatus Poribacteria bacterium]